jgi:hypothetical protein
MMKALLFIVGAGLIFWGVMTYNGSSEKNTLSKHVLSDQECRSTPEWRKGYNIGYKEFYYGMDKRWYVKPAPDWYRRLEGVEDSNPNAHCFDEGYRIGCTGQKQ